MTAHHRLLVAALLLSTGAAQAAVPPPGAAACSGCHAASAAVATAVPRLTGRAPAELVAAMQAFKTGAKPATVMDRIAKGFSDEELKAIADWYGAQKD
jgi:sulfide dehydrogenase cytochrome subunit